MKTTFLVIRHGETEWNEAGKAQGFLDSNLTPSGLLQAQALGESLRQYAFDKFYTSDLGRAVQTAEAIKNAIKIPYETDPRLRERNLGILQGLTKKEFAHLHPNEWVRFESNDPDYVIPQGESLNEQHQRVVTCIEDLAKQNRHKRLLVVTHGGVLVSMLYRAFDLPLSRKRAYSLYNATINAFSIDDDMNWTLDMWGCIDHLVTRGLNSINYE